MNSLLQNPINVSIAYERIKKYINKTPIITSKILNKLIKANIYLKVDSFQKTGAFKIRGVLNHLLELKEQNILPKKIVSYSTGNHGIALSVVAKILKIQARIYLPKNVSNIKSYIANAYGAEIIETENRQESEEKAKNDINQGFYFLHPSAHDSTIAGAGTMCYEAITQMKTVKFDAIVCACGGGGLLSGTYLAKQLLSPSSLVVVCEPKLANDAFLSIQSNKIIKLKTSPNTIADALKALSISNITFEYLKKVDHIFLVEEQEIYRWTILLQHLLKIICEPSCAINMDGVVQLIKVNNHIQNILVLISGGNIDVQTHKNLYTPDYINQYL